MEVAMAVCKKRSVTGGTGFRRDIYSEFKVIPMSLMDESKFPHRGYCVLMGEHGNMK
jgi:hypothetical protein